MPALLCAPDGFRGTIPAAGVAAAAGRGARARGWVATELPLSDGGEGLLAACAPLGGASVPAVVTGPAGRPVRARWWHVPGRAVVESALASGLVLAGGPEGNDPLGATSRGTGELVVAAARAAAADDPGAAGRTHSPVGRPGTVVVGLGGSATTDGGEGLRAALEDAGGIDPEIDLVAAWDTAATFVAAARLFGPQKGATPAQVEVLEARLARLAADYGNRAGDGVADLPGSGAAGGMGGALAAAGARLESGYGLVSSWLGLRRALRRVDAVMTGEGSLDLLSFSGKVVGGVVGDAAAFGVPCLVVAGRADPDAVDVARRAGADVVVLEERFGAARARADTAACVERAVWRWLAGSGAGSGSAGLAGAPPT